MADLLFDTQAPAAAPPSTAMLLFPLSPGATGINQWATKDSTGRVLLLPGAKNTNTADVVASGANTYLTGSSIKIPSFGLQAQTIFEWDLVMTKTAAGTAAPVWTVVVGTLGTTGDAARLTFTGPAQTAAVDTGMVRIRAVLRSTGPAGVLAGGLCLSHNLATTGFANIGSPTLQNVSAGFDTTVPNLIIGVAVNPGASGVWTHQVVKAEMLNS